MEQIIYEKGYEGLRDELRAELSKSVESFVKIGYLLKVARDTDVLKESPYSNMEEFAMAEFNIDKGTASKFMSINDRFAEGGYSDRLQSQYAGIGWSKLSIMLQLPDNINREITPVFSKSEIQTIRDEVAEEQKTTPMEHMLEGETKTTTPAEDILSKAVRQLGESEPEMFCEIHKILSGGDVSTAGILEIMAPSGENIYSIRIQGIGRYLLSLKDYSETVTLVNERTGELEEYDWLDIEDAWMKIMTPGQPAEKNWEAVYGMPFPKEKVAPVQPKDTKKVKKVNAKNPETGRKTKCGGKSGQETATKEFKEPENRINTPCEACGGQPEEEHTDTMEAAGTEQAEKPEDRINTSCEEKTEEEPEQSEETRQAAGMEEEEQLPGQMSVADIPGVVPEQKIHGEQYEERKALYLKEYGKNMEKAETWKDKGCWLLAKTELEYAIRYLELLIELDEEE
ncbi:MAG: hypothetical protein NC094_09020 [Bacteroidales bacterium]|nr:hypothetical protein [Lachnoclostridium sp.]MCM1385145.1 hypothetical protein [Lachnoclostridium sp.]MCM1465547.1 hypothetical protein [Bacteroidales bacterium]